MHRLCWNCASLLIVSSLSVASSAAQSTPRRIILDTDPGTDDALAIFLALNSPELKVEALTVVAGNVVADQGMDNALRLLSLAGRCDVPVAEGAKHPLAQKLFTAEYWHGKNGLADIALPAPRCKADGRFAPDLIVELIHKYPGEITLVPVGPLTNIAIALTKDPSIAKLVKGVVIMGGSISGGNVTGAAEANIYNDPEAAAIVFNAGWVVTMVGSDVGERTLLTRKQLAQLQASQEPESAVVAKIAEFYLDRSEKNGFSGAAMYDPLAVGETIDPTLLECKEMHVDVETKGEFTRGETVANRMGSNEHFAVQGDHYSIDGYETLRNNARVCVSSDAERFLDLFVARMKGK